MDFVGSFRGTITGKENILVCMDYLTKFPECFAMADQEAETVAKILVEEIICRHGAPKQILTDRGSNFMSAVMNQVYQLFHIHKVSTSSYHPQTDGLVERYNSTLLDMLSAYGNANQDDWDIYLPFLHMTYRTTEHKRAKMSPLYMAETQTCQWTCHFNHVNYNTWISRRTLII